MFEHMFESVKHLPRTPDNPPAGATMLGVAAASVGTNNIVLRYL
jgi:hypothetical protein